MKDDQKVNGYFFKLYALSELTKKNGILDDELESAVDVKVSESIEKRKISINDNGVNDNIHVEESSIEDSQNILKKISNEFVFDIVVENGFVKVEMSECIDGNVIPNDTSELEMCVEISEPL